MRVLQVITSLAAGGAESLLVRVVPELVRQSRWEFEICTLVPGGLFAEAASRQGLRVRCLDLGSVRSLQAPYLLKRLILAQEYDIVHSHLSYSGFYLTLAGLECRSPVLFHTEHNVWNKRRYFPILRYLERLLYSRFDRIVAVSEPVQDALIAWLGDGFSESIVVIQNGVPILPNADLGEEERSQLMTELGLTNDSRPILVAIGSLTTQKATLMLVQACCRLRGAGKDFACLIVGDGPLRARVQTAIQECDLENHVHLLGVRQDVQRLLSLADIFVMTSHWEGLPIALLEAMTAGKAIVTTSVGGIPKLVVHGMNGLLVPPRAPSRVASAVQYLLDNPHERHRLGREARETVKTRYSIETMASRLLEEYKSVYLKKHA